MTGVFLDTYFPLSDLPTERHPPMSDSRLAEAVELHGARPEQVTVTGAQAYDHWFAHSVSTDRATFCERVGLPAQALRPAARRDDLSDEIYPMPSRRRSPKQTPTRCCNH